MALLLECFILIIGSTIFRIYIHIEFAEYKAAIEIPEGKLLIGNFPKDKMKLVLAWIEIHKDELMANWRLAVDGQTVFKIEALK